MSFTIPNVAHVSEGSLLPPSGVSSLHYLVARGLPRYDDHQLRTLRILSISSSCVSLVAGFLSFYFYGAIHPQRLKFRHKLILILMVFDFLKALAILIFPILSCTRTEELGPKIINFLGFFTALSTEGGDLAILAFAIHTSLIIFNPRRSGGLYNYRYYYYVSTVLIPVLFASLAFVNGTGYSALDVWCYLPAFPIWYRLVLSFGPRYFIMLTILVLYCTIYFYVQNQLKKMDKQRKSFNVESYVPEKAKWWSLGRIFERKITEDEQPQDPQVEKEANAITGMEINIQLQIDNSQKLKTRYKVISRQIRVVFLYPIAYFFLWVFPIIGNALRRRNKAIYGISAIVSFINPFNCFVDSVVFFVREKPWRLVYSKTVRSPFAKVEKVSCWRYHLRFLPLYSLPDDAIQLYRQCRLAKQGCPADSKSPNSQGQKESAIGQQYVFEMKPEEFGNMAVKRLSPSTKHSNSSTLDDEGGSEGGMDLMDFLREGPPA